MSKNQKGYPYPALWLTALFAGGILIAWYGLVVPVLYGLLAVSVVALLVLFTAHKKTVMILLGVVTIALGILRGNSAFFYFEPAEALFVENADRASAFYGEITEKREKKGEPHSYALRCDSLKLDRDIVAASGDIRLFQGRLQRSLQPGDKLWIYDTPHKADLPANPGAFNYRRYLHLHDYYFIYRFPKQPAYRLTGYEELPFYEQFLTNLRSRIRGHLERFLQNSSAAIVKALILGEKQDIEDDVFASFQRSGVIHVLAISGLHVGFLLIMLYLPLRWLRVKPLYRFIIIAVVLLLFAALVGFKAPVVRASVMALVYLFSGLLQRRVQALQAVALAAFLILSVRPEELLLPGFQYSFIAVGGLVYGTPRLARLIPRLPLRGRFGAILERYFRQPAIASFCAVLATTSLTWSYFSTVQLGAIVANIFIIPVIGMVVMFSFILAASAFIPVLPATGLAIFIHGLLEFIQYLIAGYSTLPFIQLFVAHPTVWELLFTVIMIWAVFNLKRPKARIALLVVGGFFIINSSVIPAPKNLRITFINVGQGDAALLQMPHGKTALIDGGDRNMWYDAAENHVVPFLHYAGIDHIDYLIGSHPHSDHIGGFITILDHFPVDTLLLSGQEVESAYYKTLLQKAHNNGVIVANVGRGDILNLDPDVRAYVLHPAPKFISDDEAKQGARINNGSLVIKMLHGKNSILFTGDAEERAEEGLLHFGDFLDCDLLKVGHHGSRTSSSDAFIEELTPAFAVVSVGRFNKFKHPSPKTIRRLSRHGSRVWRTDRHGAVIFESDGKTLTARYWR